MSAPSFPRLGKLYIAVIVCAGTAAVAHSLYQLYVTPISYQWVILATLTVLSGSFTVRVPSIPVKISIQEAFVFTCVLLFGAAPATITVALDGLISSLWRKQRNSYRVGFNAAEPALSIWIASQLFAAFAGVTWFGAEPGRISGLVFPLAMLATSYFLSNTWLTAGAVAFESGAPVVQLWRNHFFFLGLNYFGGASVAALLAHNTQGIDLTALGIILPLLVISYLTFQTALGRVEDANRHVAQVDSLHLSTIETLATAIDAKDQVTHGHIRRVQAYTVGLARALGVKDPQLLKAIEAAALLHDMGKLAVPEHILNKPGKLTPAEYEKMKLHAAVGADILSVVKFPYPVVPIVRHHHESWDGTGYPDGLAGPDIPLGARILSVVDCFDALTSDRSYRPRLSDEEALKILLDGRGTAYDPIVVDTFVKVHAEIAPTELELDTHKHLLSEITRSIRPLAEAAPPAAAGERATGTNGVLGLDDLTASLAGQATLAETCDALFERLRQVVPASLCVFYAYDRDKDELVAAHVSGDGGTAIRGMRMALGQRLTGWVAANRQTIVNSDPALDLGDDCCAIDPRPRGCLSTPLVTDGGLVGVLTLYSPTPEAFGENHRRIVEAVARQAAGAIQRAATAETTTSLRDELTGLPNLERLRQLVTPENGFGRASHPLAVLLVDVDALTMVNKQFGRQAGDAALCHVAMAIRRTMRASDLVFRRDSDEFVVVLTQTDAPTAEAIASTIRDNVGATPFRAANGSSVTLTVSSGTAVAPRDGISLDQLLDASQRRLVDSQRSTRFIAPDHNAAWSNVESVYGQRLPTRPM